MDDKTRKLLDALDEQGALVIINERCPHGHFLGNVVMTLREWVETAPDDMQWKLLNDFGEFAAHVPVVNVNAVVKAEEYLDELEFVKH